MRSINYLTATGVLHAVLHSYINNTVFHYLTCFHRVIQYAGRNGNFNSVLLFPNFNQEVTEQRKPPDIGK